ncbi:MAG: S1 RNA-binding domain-containing protein [Deltaproteobacteria bacterium]|nr:S1 RNA-binding domain-containing protein [Deltaproteobacteria bacterium]
MSEDTPPADDHGPSEATDIQAPASEAPADASRQKTADLEQAERDEFLAAMEQDFDVRESSSGEMVAGTVLSVGKEYVFVDLGSKSEGMLSLEEFDEPPEPGTSVEACVLSSGADGVILSRKLAKGVRDRQFLAEAARTRIPVEGRVTGRNKGGFEVEVAGVRGFCPIGQIELRFCEDPDVHLDKRYTFLITKYDTSGRRPDLVVSRKELLKIEAERAADELRQTLKEGDVVTGIVRNIREFGAFVDLGGLDGLLPISELSHGRVDSVSDVLEVGEEVHVQVVSFDRDSDRISLSLKRLEADPWDDVMQLFPEGSRIKGQVVRLKPFGAFVELQPGVDGLIHISNMNSPERINHPKALLKIGQQVDVEVLSVDYPQRRIALARIPQEGEFGDVPVMGAVMEGKVDKVAPFGVFVLLGPGRKGLVPNAELGIARGADARKEFPAGSPIKVEVIEVTEGGRRIRLSRKSVLDAEERQDFESYLGDDGKAQAGFGTLGDLLKKKLEKT